MTIRKSLLRVVPFLKKVLVIYVFYPFRAKSNFKKLKKYYNNSNSNEFIDEAIQVLSVNNKLMIPFKFIDKYSDISYDVIYDSSGFPSITIDNHKVYFPKKAKKQDIIGSVKTHLIEQDQESPHKYITDNTFCMGHTAILVGASDGLLALDLLNSFEHIYLIESDINWIEPLTKTFNLYKEKITIINAFASDITTENQLKLDDIFKDYKYSIDFLQADVEGAACQLLRGAENLLKNHLPNLAFACYHTHDEADEISNMLEKLSYNISFSKRFVYLWMQILKEPYIRKGVLYANKSSRNNFEFTSSITQLV